MLRATILGLMIALLATPVMAGNKVGGRTLPDNLEVGGETLSFNGAGLRKKLFIKVYAGALYLKAKSKDRAAVIAADEVMAIRMHFIYKKVESDKLTTAWNEGFVAALGADKSAHQAHIDAFNDLFKDDATKDDVYDITYIPGTGVQVHINGQLKGTVDGGLDFKKAVFAIWLGDNSPVKDLGKAMMG